MKTPRHLAATRVTACRTGGALNRQGVFSKPLQQARARPCAGFFILRARRMLVAVTRRNRRVLCADRITALHRVCVAAASARAARRQRPLWRRAEIRSLCIRPVGTGALSSRVDPAAGADAAFAARLARSVRRFDAPSSVIAAPNRCALRVRAARKICGDAADEKKGCDFLCVPVA